MLLKFTIRRWLFIAVLLTLPALLHAQAIIVTGKVLTDDNAPMPGVTIMLKKDATHKQGIGITNNNGEFTVSVSATDILEFTYVGFESRQIPVKGKVHLVVAMRPSSKSLKEAVVVGYQRKTKEVITGSVTRITADEIKDVPVSNVEQLLQGKVAGLSIQNNTGSPGFRGSTVLRGLSQIAVSGSGNNAYLTPASPLYVIDGVPVDANAGYEYGFQSKGPGTSPLSMIPPEDIATIDIMKDADAAALYGSRGANGVIVITTKRGKSAVPIVRLFSSFFMNTTPPLRKTVGGLSERDFLVNEILSTYSQDEINKISKTPFLSDSLNPFFNNSTNWQALYYKPTFNQTHNLSVSGGTQVLSYKTNFNYYRERGVIKNTGFDRYAASLNLDYNPSEKFKISGSVTAGLGKKLKGSGNGLTDVGAGSGVASSLLPGPSYFLNVSRFTGAINRKSDSKTYNFRTYIDGTYEFLPHVRIGNNISYDYTDDTEDNFIPALANGDQSAVYGYSGHTANLYDRSSLTYSNTFKEKHTLYASVFSELIVGQTQAREINLNNGPNDVYHGPLGFSSYYGGYSGIEVNGGYLETHSVGLAANLTYDFSKKYVINFNYRADGNSYAGVKDRWAKSPSLGLKWNFDKEEFMKGLSWLDFGDLRATYGVNLRPSTNVFASLGSYLVNGNYNNVSRITPKLGIMPNPYLKPERVEQYNLGIDLSLLKGRFAFTVETYQKVISNMLYDRNLSTSTGFTKTVTNESSMMNKGYEVTISIRPLPASSKFFWNLSLNWAVSKDILLELPGGATQVIYSSDNGPVINKVGRNTLSNFLYLTDGVYSSNDDVPIDPITGLRMRSSSGGYFHAGDTKYKDVDGNYIVDTRDLQIAGNPVPRLNGGFYSTMTYKNFSFAVSGTILYHRDLLNNALSERLGNLYYPFGNKPNTDGPLTLPDVSQYNYWKKAGDQAKYPNPLNYNGNTDNYNPSQSLFQEDGSFFKINSVTLGYTFNRELIKKAKLNNARVYFTGANVLMLSKYSGPNPENVTTLGRDRLDSYPSSPSYTLGLNLEF
ncbi:TonB-linked SusC/RagA family outer membrane protein [Chitinophaga niastensis]|uniref:TonB-linked SusC/RagA family outer membrane protein n=1 Tax=Chitinophaga niastensis TaxID=536980 RepID=A0A2P8HDT4_CHINA|nr:SusC/RagA family TonB-linked outer membrane protein [Chitinophaga niastensis]PSL44383.1 TonB-linked SusC/RagA family outer membrane protein [Chitinophaga niastensis]